MPKYIDADVTIDAVNRLSLGETDAVKLSMRIVDYLNRIPPTADVVPVRHGRWIKQSDRTKSLYGWSICSECGAVLGSVSPYCSECGAKMDGGAIGDPMEDE